MPALTLVLLSFAVGQIPRPPTDAAAINAAKTAIVQDIDKTLPRLTVEAWLRELVGAKTPITWEVNDCGEQTGSPADRGRDFPVCAEAQVALPGNRTLGLLLAVGSQAKGLNPDRPFFYFGYVKGPKPDELKFLKTLAEVPKIIKP